MTYTFRMLAGLLDRHEKRRALLVFLLMLAVAVMEAVGVASVMPFIAVLSNPSVVETNPALSALYDRTGAESREQFMVFLGILVFVLLVSSLALKALAHWAHLRFATMRGHVIGCRLVAGYLGQPYQWFLHRHSSGLATTILAEVNEVVNRALFPALQLVANGLIVVLLVALLVAVDPALAMSASLLVGGAYFCIVVALRRLLKRLGEERRKANRERFHVVQEAFGGIKDVKIAGLEQRFASRFRSPSRRLARYRVASGLIAELPSYAMQTLLFGGMMLLLLYLMTAHGDLQGALPVVGLYAFAGYRLLPAVQAAYRNYSELRFSQPALEALHRDFAELDANRVGRSGDGGQRSTERLRLRERLELQDVQYAYPDAERAAVHGVSLSIDANSTVAFVGPTGSGKTSTVDIILGLLRPSEGSVLVDGVELDESNLRQWQRNLGYVPQQIYLSDDTVAANIAFGVPADQIDQEAVERAARTANLHDFVTDELPHGYATHVGERGVRLSGGQRQRIGIARALYHDPDVLILDEATSALDNVTERAVMEAVNNLGSKKTIVLIAHRLSTVRNCSQIFLLDHGRLVASGSYEQLVECSDQFRQMAAVVQ